MKNISDALNRSTAVVLVGGMSSRMNYNDKYKLKLRNKTFLDNIIDELDIFDNVLLSINKNQDLENYNQKVCVDEIEKIGPIGGLYTALNNIETDIMFICSCDMPNISKEIIETLYYNLEDGYDCVVPVVGDDEYPLFAIYSIRVKEVLRENINNSDYKIKNLLKKLKVKYVEFESNEAWNFANINTVKEYEVYCGA